jgi:uncharacterized protein YcfJ
MKISLILGAAMLSLAAPAGLAQPVEQHTTTVVKEKNVTADTVTTSSGAITGAFAGAAVGGPVGAVVGALAGGAIGHVAAPPGEVKTYVTTQEVAPASYSGRVSIGHRAPDDVTWLDVPDYPKYRWAYLGDHRVVIDAETHNVVAVY